jgi:UDP-2,3-diacylglucosamine pyrophosphatase LpxH
VVAAPDPAEYPVLRLAYLGDRGYDFLLWLNHHFNWLRGKFGAPYWSLSYVKNRVKQALEFINSFEQTLARECASRGYYGVVCGTPPTVFITAL